MSEPDPRRLADACVRLTDGQRTCLRLVREHKTSKEIARLLGISRYTVDQRVERACQILGVEKRTEAALILEHFGAESVSERLVYHRSGLGGPPTPIVSEPSTPPETGAAEHREPDTIGNHPLDDEAAGSRRVEALRGERSSWLADSYYPKGDPDALLPTPRIRWIIQLTIQILVSILVLVAIGQVLSTVAHRVWPVRKEAAQN